MFSDSDRSKGGDEAGGGGGKEANGGVFFRGTRGAVSGEAGRLISNERRQLAGSAEVNS